MDIAEQIFEKHIGLNAEMGYKPITKQDVLNCINEALNRAENLPIHNVVGQSEQLVCSCGSRLVKTTGGYHCGNAKCSV